MPTVVANPSEDQKLKQASADLGVPFVHLRNRVIPEKVLTIIPHDVAREHGMVAYEQADLSSGKKVLRLAVCDPGLLERDAPAVINELHAKQGMLIEVALTPQADLDVVLSHYPKLKEAPTDAPKLASPAGGQQTTPQAALPEVDLTRRSIPKDVLERIPEETARKYRVIAFDFTDQVLHVAIEQPDNPQVQELLAFIREQNHLDLNLYRASDAGITYGLEQYRRTTVPLVAAPDLAKLQAEQKSDGLQPDPSFWQDDRKKESPAKTVAVASAPEPSARSEKVTTTPDKHSERLANPKKEPEHKPAVSTSQSEAATNKAAEKPKPAGKTQTDHHAAATETRRNFSTPTPAIAPVVRSEDLLTPDLLVPKSETPDLLIPVDADVERDLRAIVGQEIQGVQDLEAVVKTGFIPKIVGAVLLLAAQDGASDIHLQADDKQLVLRNRVDGILQDVIRMPVTLQAPLVSRIKILAKLKIDEQRIPQDGRFEVLAGKKEIDLRVSTFPTVRGEKVVIRLLDKTTGLLKLPDMGLLGSRLARLEGQIRKPYGVILATGPTGSGKTTTLYAVLQEIAGPEVNVVTLEDPVEYEIPGINQAQIKPKIGFGFAEGLRSILRQDPNIIMVGEIRDLETASMMTQSALTGHLVLSTLHTNDAAGALPRLVNMGVEPFLITSAMNAVIAQRLVRRLCPDCRVESKVPTSVIDEIKHKLGTTSDEDVLKRLNEKMTIFEPKGCNKCTNGYRGRIGVYEVLIMSDGLEELVVKKAPASEIQEKAVAEGMVTMEQDGLLKVLDGATSLEEVWRVTKAE